MLARRWFGAALRAVLGGWVLIPATVAMTASAAPGVPQAPPRPEFRFHGAVVRVTDMGTALAFYSEVLGFAVASDQGTPRSVRLAGDFPLYLRQTRGLPGGPDRSGDGRQVSRAGVTFMTADIVSRTKALRGAGVEFLGKSPHKVGVGLAIFFRDPFGTVHSLLQQTAPVPAPFEEPKVYNSGFSHSEAAKTRPLYVKTLGFVVRTEKYFPPALPLGHAEGTSAFMLHEKPGLRPAANTYPEGPGTTLVFTTPDADAAMAYLQARGVDIFRPPADAAAPGILAFRDAYGVVSEIWSGTAPKP